jgi:hypothetical protein
MLSNLVAKAKFEQFKFLNYKKEWGILLPHSFLMRELPKSRGGRPCNPPSGSSGFLEEKSHPEEWL